MTRTLAVELAKNNVLVNSVSPGFTMTDLTKKSLSEEEMNDIIAGIPIGRFADPEEIAKLVLFMCSEENTYIVGQNIIADGGFTNV
jgi:3-oxoacyl-[acyl-carrier protein] reductase